MFVIVRFTGSNLSLSVPHAMPMLLVRSKCARISRGVYMLTRLYVIVVRFINTILMHSKCARISSVYMLTRLCVIVVRFINTILTPCRCCWCARWSIVDWISKTLTNGPLSGCWKPTLTWMHRGTRLINHHKQKTNGSFRSHQMINNAIHANA